MGNLKCRAAVLGQHYSRQRPRNFTGIGLPARSRALAHRGLARPWKDHPGTILSTHSWLEFLTHSVYFGPATSRHYRRLDFLPGYRAI
jgi:hypothetical protein